MQLLTPKELAEMLSVSTITLERWRQQGRGPRYIKLARGRQSLIRYRREAVESFLDDCARASTTEAASVNDESGHQAHG